MFMADLLYAYEKLSAGVTKLTTHPGPIKARLIAAFSHSLLQMPSNMLPDEAQKQWQRDVWAKVFAEAGSRTEGSLVPTINAMDEVDAVRVAEAIVNIESLARRAVDQHLADVRRRAER